MKQIILTQSFYLWKKKKQKTTNILTFSSPWVGKLMIEWTDFSGHQLLHSFGGYIR